MAQPIKEHGSRAFALPGATPPTGFAIFFLNGGKPPNPHSKTFLDEPSGKAVTALVLHAFSSRSSSKTFRTKRSLEECKFFESILSLGLRNAIWGTKYEMLFERSEFIEWFEEFVFRPLSSGRFRALSFASVFFLATERKWRFGFALQKMLKIIGRITDNSDFIAIFAVIL